MVKTKVVSVLSAWLNWLRTTSAKQVSVLVYRDEVVNKGVSTKFGWYG